MPVSGGCLYECLKEAHLESYYSSFVRHGIIKCEGLAGLSMHEYSRFGVLSMEDRVRLFKLVQIVKSVLADGLHCQHEYPTLRTNNVRTHMTNDAHVKAISELTRVQGERQYTTAVNIAPKVKLDTRSQAKTAVEYKPGSDTPLFRCRKILTFSDSEDEGEESVARGKQEKSPARHVAVAQVKPSSVERVKTHTTKSQDADKNELQEQKNVSPKCKPPQVFYVNLESPCPTVRTPETQVEKHSNVSDIVYVDDKNDSGNNSASTQNKSALSTGKGSNGSCERSGTGNLFDMNQSDLSNYSADSAGRIRPSSESGLYSRSISSRSRSASPPKPCTSHNSYDLAQNNTDNHLEMLSEIHDMSKSSIEVIKEVTVESPGRHRSPVRPISAFFIDEVAQKDHAYFPQFQPPKKFETRVETVVHNSDYNYGVPGVESSPKSCATKSPSDRKSVSRKTRNRDEKIRVCVRKRPLLKKETKRQEADIVATEDFDAVVVEESKVTIDLSKYIQKHVFLFDEVFDSSCSNHDVYEGTAKPLVQHVIRGGCGTCFAFGQTGAGKTFTLLGDKAMPGLYQLAAKDLFFAITGGHWGQDVHLWLSYYEIYCGQLYDLLNKRKRLTVRENGKQKVCIAGLMETEVKTFNNLIHAVEYGNNVRSIGNTGVNPKSSRSHAVLTLEVRNKQDHLMGKLSFIDLAGSERASDVTEFNKQTRKEGAEINQSLLALKECIRSLDQQEQHTPYRQSKLTHILRDSFLGNSKTCMIANVSPIQSACENTLNTLRYADRVKELRKDQERSAMLPISEKNKPLNLFEAGPSLFHPSTIQGSSTPKKKSLIPNQDKSFDANNVFQDVYESPIRGHKLHKLSSKKKKESTNSGIELSPHKSNNASPSSRGRSRSNSANRSNDNLNHHSEELRRAVSQDNIQRVQTVSSRDNSSERPEFARTHPGTSKTPNYQTSPNINTVKPNSAGRWSHGPHMDNRFSSTSDVQHNVKDMRSQRKLRKEDILQEHKEILSHLDDIMYRARAAMTKSTAMDRQISAVEDASPEKNEQRKESSNQSNSTARNAANTIVVTGNRSPAKARNMQPSQTNDYPSILESQEFQHRSPMADQLRLAQIRLRKQQELLQIQQQQIHAMNRDSNRESDFVGDNSVGPKHGTSPPQSEDQESRIMDIRTVENDLLVAPSTEGLERSPKVHPDNRKPKLSGTDLVPFGIQKSPAEHASHNNSGGQGFSIKEDELEKSLPAAEDFLKSLAEIKLNKQLTSAGKAANSGSRLNVQQLAQLEEHFKRLGIDTRPFQDLLGSPSNTRDGKGTAFQPYERKTTVRKQLSFPDKLDEIVEERRASADGEETDSQVQPPAKQFASGKTAVIAPSALQNDSTMPTIPQTGAITQRASFTPIDPHPVTTQSQPEAPVTGAPPGYSVRDESLKLDLADLADDELTEERERPKSSREHNRKRNSGESGGRLNGVNTARGRMENPGESSDDRAKLQFIVAHEDQLAEITTICKQEMKLLMGVKMGDQSFEEYIKSLRNVLSSKVQCVASLSAQIQELESMSQNDRLEQRNHKQ